MFGHGSASPCRLSPTNVPTRARTGSTNAPRPTTKKADDALNGVYRDITRRLKDDAATTKLLVGAQKAWIQFRDAECTFANSDNAGGSIYPMVYNGCLTRLTKARTHDLQLYLKCSDDALGCPAPK